MRIALIGGMRSGKDTFFNIACETYSFKRIAFADAIRDILEQYFPDVPKEPKPREAMQLIGQTFRSIQPDVWIKALDRKVTEMSSADNPNLILTDLRMSNELQWARDNGFIIVQILCDEKIRLERYRKDNPAVSMEIFHHPTEMLSYDRVGDICMYNEGTYSEYVEMVCVLLDELMGGGQDEL